MMTTTSTRLTMKEKITIKRHKSLPRPLIVFAQISAPGLTVSNASVSLTLPKDLELPVALSLPVEVRDTLPVSLDVRAVIPLKNTQLHDVAENLRLLFEPLAVGLTNLPGNFSEVGPFVGDVLAGKANLLQANQYTAQPWPGFSTTAGLNYPIELLTAPIPLENLPIQTGIVPQGGIPALDEQLRPNIYAAGGPNQVNQGVRDGFNAQGAPIPSFYYDGGYADYRMSILTGQPLPAPTTDPGAVSTPVP